MDRLAGFLKMLIPSGHTVGYWASVAALMASGITIYLFWATPGPKDETRSDQFSPSGTGNLGLQFQQQGLPLRVEKIDENEMWSYTAEIEVARAPVQILVPKQHCEGPSDQISIHAIVDQELEEVSRKISAMHQRFAFGDLSLGGYIVATERSFVTDLYGDSIDLEQENPFLRGFNFFTGTRYSGEAEGKWLINIESIEGRDGPNAIMTAQNVVLVFIRDAWGSEDRFWHLDVVGLRFAE